MTQLPSYVLEWHDESCRWTAAPESPRDQQWVARQIAADDPLRFDLIAPAARLGRLSVSLATYARRNSADLICTISDAFGNTMLRTTLAADSIQDNALACVAEFADLSFAIGAKYCVELSSPTATEGDSFAAWVRDVPHGIYELRKHILSFRNCRSFDRHDESMTQNGNVSKVVLAIWQATAGPRSIVRTAAETLLRAFPDAIIDVVEAESPVALWPLVVQADVVAFANAAVSDPASPTGFDALCFELYRRGTVTIQMEDRHFDGQWPAQVRPLGNLRSALQREVDTARRAQFILYPNPRLIDSERAGDELPRPPLDIGRVGALDALIARARLRRTPKVAIVSVLFRKASILPQFIECVLRQDYSGDIELILVDDRSPDGEAALVQLVRDDLARNGTPNRTVTLLFNDANLGNCASRLNGIAAASADIYIVIDCDCLINEQFVSAHVFEHARDDVDVVIGPLNIEANDRDPHALLTRLEALPEEVLAESGLQDPIQPDAFVNCITRNFSAKRRIVEHEPLFDLDFSYSTRPGSGFGWEDVEMGYRLYARGAIIRVTNRAFSVHASHASSVSEADKIAGSMRNFERLFTKHPEMELVARRWALDTFDRMLNWAHDHQVDAGEPQRALERRFSADLEARQGFIRGLRPGARRLRVLTYRWHIAHQYELYKLPHDFTLATHAGDNGMINSWSHDQRPLHPNVRFARLDQIDPRDFDIAILHFDENVLHPHLCNSVMPSCWGDPFRAFLALPDISKVAVCHGTPQFQGQYGANPEQIREFVVHDAERLALVDALAASDVRVVCNSHQALEEWRFADARVIWHGFDPQQFPPGTHVRDVLALSPDRYRPHYRGVWEHERIKSLLDPGIRIETAAHAGAAIERRETHAFAVRNFRSYVDRIRQFTVYLNTTLRSPMPRSRGEAMMTGVIPVCLRNHDVDRFIDQGVNGFYADEPDELADRINFLMRNRSEARRMGAAARRTAIDLFNHDRYLEAWQALLAESAG